MRQARNSVLVLLLLLMLPALQAQQESSSQEAQSSSEQVLGKLQVAAIQHEAIALLIEEQKFQSIVPELKKIFDLALPPDYEIYEVQEVQSIAQKLRTRDQLSLAHAVVDLGLKNLEGDKSKLSLYLLKSQLYRDSGQIREATEATEMARKLYQSSLRGSKAE